jgi:hypothetical protein
VSETEPTSTVAGWYDDGSGRQRYWNGDAWTEHFADTYSARAATSVRSRRLQELWGRWTSRERWVAVGSAAGTVLGIVGLILPIAVADRGASVDTVGVDSQLGEDGGLVAADASALEPVSSGLSASAAGLTASTWPQTVWAVPIDAPWDELFALDVCRLTSDGNYNEADTEAADAWIERHGVPSTPHRVYADISNTAGSGSITISAIRPQGTLTPAPDRVWVTQNQCGGRGDCSELIDARIALGADPVAVFGDPPTIDSCGSGSVSDIVAQPGDPVVFDVAPGQYRPLYITWTQTEDFSGRFVATVTAGGETSTIDLSPGNVDITSLAVNGRATLSIGDGNFEGFVCDPDGNAEAAARVAGNSTSPCTLTEWLAMIGKG